MDGVAQGASFDIPDLKHPGWRLGQIVAASVDAHSVNAGLFGSMTKVWARLYKSGAGAAILTAPHAQGSSTKKTIVVTATGGVVIKSLIEPGTILTADTVTWYASLNQIVASGHAFYRNGKTGITLRSPTITGDTALGSVHGGQGRLSGTF